MLLLALALVAGQRWLPEWREARREMLPAPPCNLHRSICVISLPGGKPLSLAISPRPIAPARPLVVEVATGAAVERVAIEFAGVAMEMGLNRVELQRVAAGRYRGDASLPICTTGRMEWQAVLEIELGGRLLGLPIRFFTPEAP